MRGGYDGLRIGLDLDNTLISYDALFRRLAAERGLLPAGFSGAKRDVRDAVRSLPDGELHWRRLQALAYGAAIGDAQAAPGALDFIREARRSRAQLMIVSHKTTHSNLGGETVNLHDAARGWLRANGIVAPDAICETDVHFEQTRAAKIARITALQCTHFIDDLEEVLNDETFPPQVRRMLYGRPRDASSRSPYAAYPSFAEIARAFAA